MGRAPYIHWREGFTTVEMGSWPGLPWYRKIARWLRVIPRAELRGWIAFLRHNPRRCYIVHNDCPGPGCQLFPRRFIRDTIASVASTGLDHYWEPLQQAIRRHEEVPHA